MPDSNSMAAVKKAGGNLDNPAYAPNLEGRVQHQLDPNRVADPTTQPPLSPLGRTFFDTDKGISG